MTHDWWQTNEVLARLPTRYTSSTRVRIARPLDLVLFNATSDVKRVLATS